MTQVPQRSTHVFGRACNVLAVVLGVLAVFVVPVVTGLLAVIAGVVGYRHDPRIGRWALLVAVVGAVVGIVLFYGVRGHEFLEIT
jgi:hypothetical protein